MALQNFDPSKLRPAASATLIFELRQLTERMASFAWDEAHHIRILYFNETFNPIKSDPYVLKIPACVESEICTVKTFFGYLANLTLDHNQWLVECSETSRSAGSLTAVNYGLAFAALLLSFTYQLHPAMKFSG